MTGLVAAGYFGSEPGNEFVAQIIRDINEAESVTNEKAWRTVGPLRLTEAYRKYQYTNLRIYPSRYFIPRHFLGLAYEGTDPVYADQLWGTTLTAYDEIHRREVSIPAASNSTPVAAAPAPAAPSAAISTLETKHDPYFVQKVEISTEILGVSRMDMFGSLDEVTDGYDVVLCPEVMEHVADVAGFLAQLEAIDASTYLISVPDAFQCRERHFDYVADAQTLVEVVHPDHNVWYTPYTFANTVRKYSGPNIEKMWFFNRISLLALLSKDQVRLAA